METLEFSAGMQLGIDLIDRQHGRFFEIMNRMIAADVDHENRDLINDVIGELADYVSDHFRCEEDLMEQFDYPDLMAHQRQHVQFAAMVEGFHRKYSQGEIGLEDEMLRSLTEWFIGHIRHEDPKYVALFRENGLSDY